MAEEGKASPKRFRQRYDELEAKREALAARLERLGADARAHPSYKAARVLLTRKFRDAKLVQRGAILAAAEWVVELIARSMPFV